MCRYHAVEKMTRNSNALMRDGSVKVDSDLVEFLSGSTDSAINFSGSVDFHTNIHPPPYKRAESSPMFVISSLITWSWLLYNVARDSHCVPFSWFKHSISWVSWVSWKAKDSLTRPYITRKVSWYSSTRLPRNSASPPSEFSWKHSLHCWKRATKPSKSSSVFGTKNLLTAVIGVQSPSKIALIESCRLTSWFINLEFYNMELDIRGARDTAIGFMNWREKVSIARSVI